MLNTHPHLTVVAKTLTAIALTIALFGAGYALRDQYQVLILPQAPQSPEVVR